MRTTILLAASLAACAGTEDAATVSLPVTTAGEALPRATTDLGYTVLVETMRAAVSTIQFTIEGEVHAVTTPPGTLGHPGHAAGGEVTGELPGDFVLAWTGQPRPPLGTGTLIVGDYRGANFSFRAADARDNLPAGDPLLGHTFHLTGTVARDTTLRPFDAVLDVEAGASVIGAVFEDRVTEASTETLAIAFLPADPSEQDTAFDGVDFFTLPTTAGGAIEIRPGSAAHNVIRRAIQTHDHYAVQPR